MPGRLALTLLALTLPASLNAQDADLPAKVKEVFRAHCHECHGGAKTLAKLDVFSRKSLLKVVEPNKPDDSELFGRVTATDGSRMPESPRPALAADQIELVRKWIAAGAPELPADVAPPEPNKEVAEGAKGTDHVLRSILAHVRTLKHEERPFVRYFSLNHVLTGGATADELARQRDALTKAINHLSLAADLCQPQPIDAPHNTVYAVDMRKVGWHVRPFRTRANTPSPLTLWDLVLLEYPYSVAQPDGELFQSVAEEYLRPGGMARPVSFVRSDWFCATATLPPLYDDLLQLPNNVAALERRLGIDVAGNLERGVALRAGMALSGVSRNNRVVERHPGGASAYYWKSLDFRSNKGRENMFTNPLDPAASGGEMIFGLPNGLQGYYVADGQGRRIEAAPTEIVTDAFATDKIVRNGLSCMRCHDAGMKEFKDDVRPALLKLPGEPGFDRHAALKLYPEKELDELLKRDRERFVEAVTKLLGKKPSPANEPLIGVTRRYLDDEVSLPRAVGELGLEGPADLAAAFRLPKFAALGLIPLARGGVVRRDAWEDYFDLVVTSLGLGVPMPPLDGVTRRDFPAGTAPLEVVLRTNRKNNLFTPGDELVIEVENRSGKTAFVELVGTGVRGEKIVLTKPGLTVAAGATFRFPEKGGIAVKGGQGREQITPFASAQQFAVGEVLRAKLADGFAVADRVVHGFDALEQLNGRWTVRPAAVVKKTLEIETR